MFPYDHLYELIQDYQREKQAAAERYRIAREAEQGSRQQPAGKQKPLRARLGLGLVSLGNRLLESVPYPALQDSQRSPCTD